MARASDAGLHKIRSQALSNRNVRFESQVGKKIAALSETLHDSPIEENFFTTTAMLAPLEYGDPHKEVLRYAKKYTDEMSLTVSEVKTPDFLSFPERLTTGMQMKAGDRRYPSISSLNFE